MDVIIFHCHVWLPEVSICGSKVCGWPWVHGHHRVLLWCSEKNMSFKTIGTTVAMESRVTSYRDPPKKIKQPLPIESWRSIFHLFVGVDIHLPTKITPSPWSLAHAQAKSTHYARYGKPTSRSFSLASHGLHMGFPLVFQSMLGNLARFSAFLMGNLAISCHILKVRHIQATIGAFAAILKNGRVVTWGHPCCGGDISSFQDTLRNVQDMEPLGVQRLRVGREPLGATNATRFPST